MPRALKLYDTLIGKKVAMAASGIILLGFVLAHMAGNLNLYLGAAAMNEYAVSLRQLPFGALWVARGVLLIAVVVHIVSSFQLWSANADARETRYQKRLQPRLKDYAARTMYWSGPIVLIFILYHLAHLTFGLTPGQMVELPNGETRHFVFWHSNVYNNVVFGFQQPLIAGFYIVANIMLAFHLYHGAWSIFQTLGASHPRYNPLRRRAATAFAGILLIGNVSFPVACLLGKYTDKYGIALASDAECYEELDPDWYPEHAYLCGRSLMTDEEYADYRRLTSTEETESE